MRPAFQFGNKVIEFLSAQNERADFSLDISFSFSAQIVQMIWIDVSHKYQINDPCIFALGIIINDKGLFQITQSVKDAINDLIQPHDLADHGFQLREKGVFCVCCVKNISSVFLRG